jgi:hypothetical protein
MGDIGADQSADPGGVDVGNAREIHDESGGLLGTDGALEQKQSSEHNWALETKDSLAGLGSVKVLNAEWFL